MKIKLLKMGKVKNEFNQILQHYQDRLKPFGNTESVSTKHEQQTLKLISNSNPRPYLVCLDEQGHGWTSVDTANFIRRQADGGQTKELLFIVGPPYGLGSKLTTQANMLWSLSPATLPADMAWLLLHEQIYRALTIIQGSPYHHA